MDYCELAIALESGFDLPEIPDSDLFKLRTASNVVDYVEAAIDVRDRAAAARAAGQ
jgi:acyl carrier protein